MAFTNSLIKLILSLILLGQTVNAVGFSPQSIGVIGHLECNGVNASGVLVKVYNKNLFYTDNLIAQGATDVNGNIRLIGTDKELLTNMNIHINIYHHCNHESIWCARRVTVKVPTEFITKGKETADRFFDIGTHQLNEPNPEEEKDCFH
uniref:Transthyretin-like family protein n=1 Tax=Rhabditophanes sp. KR3021 TaxID=114890 RepID=A0AC35U2B9_9BILA